MPPKARRFAKGRRNRRTARRRGFNARVGGDSFLVRCRRLIETAPAKVSGTNKPGKWWFESISGFAFILFKLLVAVVTSTASDGVIVRTVTATICSVQRISVGVSDMLVDSPIASRSGLSRLKVGFEQGRLSSATVRINPAAHLLNRGGNFAMAIVPFSETEAIQISERRYADQRSDPYVISGHDTPVRHFSDVCALPGAKIFPATKPFQLTYHPRTGDRAMEWQKLSWNSWQPRGMSYPAPSALDLVFDVYISYCDNSENTSDTSPAYALTEASFQMTLSGQVHVRAPCEGWNAALVPPVRYPPSTVLTVEDGVFDECEVESLTFADTPDDMSVLSV